MLPVLSTSINDFTWPSRFPHLCLVVQWTSMGTDTVGELEQRGLDSLVGVQDQPVIICIKLITWLLPESQIPHLQMEP